MTLGQILSHATRIFNENPIPKCATVRCSIGAFYYGSPYRLDILTKILRIIFN